MGTSVLHIKTEVECHVYLFDEEKGDDCFCSVFKASAEFSFSIESGKHFAQEIAVTRFDINRVKARFLSHDGMIDCLVYQAKNPFI